MSELQFQLSSEQFEAVQDQFNDVRDDYSGRGMYGATCVAVVGDAATFADFIQAVTEVTGGAVRARSLASICRQDSMGFDTVYYWPGLTVAQ